MKDNFKQLSERLGAERVKMPVRELSRAPTSRSAMTRPNAKKGFVAPIVAPLQKEEVKVKKQVERACAWAPNCGRKAAECGGWKASSCMYFGKNGTDKTDKGLLSKKSGLLPAVTLQETVLGGLIVRYLPTAVCGGWSCTRCVVSGIMRSFRLLTNE